LRRFASLGKSTRVLSRTLEVAFRKPFFAGDTVRVSLRAFAAPNDRLGSAGVFVPPNDASAKPHTYVRMTFAP
jgi:hypothetical protein